MRLKWLTQNQACKHKHKHYTMESQYESVHRHQTTQKKRQYYAHVMAANTLSNQSWNLNRPMSFKHRVRKTCGLQQLRMTCLRCVCYQAHTNSTALPASANISSYAAYYSHAFKVSVQILRQSKNRQVIKPVNTHTHQPMHLSSYFQ